MPSINFDSETLDSADDLYALMAELANKGWIGALGYAAVSISADAPLVWRLDMHTSDGALVDGTLGPDGIRRITATLGDWKVTIGTSITTMTPEVYTASYGT